MSSRHEARLVTAAFVLRDGDVLLKRHGPGGDRFADRWNGIGGHVEPGEDVRAAARRELREETGLEIVDLCLRGIVHESGLVGAAHVVFFFVGEARMGEVQPEAGTELAWHPLAKLSDLPLVEDLRELLPRLLAADEPVFAVERYSGGDRLESLEIEGERIERV